MTRALRDVDALPEEKATALLALAADGVAREAIEEDGEY